MEREHEREVMDARKKTECMDAAMERFKAILEADAAVSQRVRKEVDQMDMELRHVQEARDQLDRQVQQTRQDLARAEKERRETENRLDDMKQRLAEIREDRRAHSLEGAAMRRDHEHFQEELDFLQRMMAEEQAKLEETYRSNQMLERSTHGLEVNTFELEKQRHAVLKEVAEEEINLRGELRKNAEMRIMLQQMWREQHSSHMGRQEAYLKQQRYRQMQGDGAVDPRAAEALAHPDDKRHSWAAHVSSASDPISAWVS